MRLGQLVVTPADEQDRAHGADLAAQIQAVNGETVELADVDHGDTGAEPAAAARAHGLELAVVNQTFAKRGSV